MPRVTWRPFSAHLSRLALVLLAVACLSGCGGCGSQPISAADAAKKAKEEAKKKEEEEKEPFEVSPPTPLLSESLVSVDEDRPLRLTKPGHWTTTVQPMRANDDNYEGRTTLTPVDGRGDPLALPYTPFALASSRPALLAKGRIKRVQNELLIPVDADQPRVRATLSGAEAPPRESAWTLMPSHQYFLLVLAREPARYAYLKVTDAVRAPLENDSGEAQPHYRVVLADATKTLPLPVNVLTWTSVAYIFWDEVNLDRLAPAQQQALVDWIHWGGRLIVNGPDSLATLRGSFLDAHLPADPGAAKAFESGDVSPLSDYWSSRSAGKLLAPIAMTHPWSGVELKPRDGARPLAGTAGLFYERPVGSGSIVVSAVQLGERDLVNWPGFDGFLNGALLRRPPRVFRVESDAAWVGLQTLWAGAGYATRTRDAHFTTPLRWFARDAGAKANAERVPLVDAQAQQQAQLYGTQLTETQLVVDSPGGLGSWNDFGPVPQTAREALSIAAGVRVPGSGFVVICLALYLVVLVPLNWMVFQALNRVEWAWIAAPVIALAGAVAVVRQAQLDIGFVRSQTEIALLELQSDHPRGHLSRYTALYTSLATVYDFELEDPSSVATPFPIDPQRNDMQDRGLLGLSASVVEFENYDRPRLRGVPVASASTQFIHSEQIYPLEGGLRLAHPSTTDSVWQLENRTGLDLSDAVVVHRREPNDPGRATYESCWVGQLRHGSSLLLQLTPVSDPRNELPYAAERREAARLDARKRLDVDALLRLAFRFPRATDPLYGVRDEWRLVARLDEALPGSATTPAASQTTGATVILAHLHCKLGPEFGPDENSPADVLGDRPRNAYEEDAPPEEEVN